MADLNISENQLKISNSFEKDGPQYAEAINYLQRTGYKDGERVITVETGNRDIARDIMEIEIMDHMGTKQKCLVWGSGTYTQPLILAYSSGNKADANRAFYDAVVRLNTPMYTPLNFIYEYFGPETGGIYFVTLEKGEEVVKRELTKVTEA